MSDVTFVEDFIAASDDEDYDSHEPKAKEKKRTEPGMYSNTVI